ncbi:tripartite tricarboxylate transporter substrate binding protein BugD [Aurantimonas endophytica]|uniref:Tripartite-type tricarboxylate transporter receptor subunit TctC n=1 Tax=Aurantimonas endophytica TaxID=1522175 RepID=A0A7W6MPD4_9HYPH|nr:tripartite tricarboxylate transporter substrate binding protein BugD [Aurantimonas endophytica]MBB4002895.1 tripartite-type tricarboxylate transporter receptor subunit TctC [Aurantimonas endophytica]MCO6403772.1 tripartite tricarboxylate transporter substrate binding protein BugD [Aurantimonas endophytica]
MKTTTWLGASLIVLAAGSASAQDYPTQPITMVVPFAAGGPTDTVARLIAEPMSRELGQQIVVQNVAGAGGTLAGTQVANAEPDGYKILIHHIGMSTAPTLYRNLPYDPTTDFLPIGLVTDVPMTVIGRKDLAPTTMAELIPVIKEQGDQLTYANAGIGAASHLCGLLLMTALDTQMTTVPYQGTGPAMTDLIGGQVDLMCDQTTNTTGQIKGGEVKAYAVTTKERLDALPDVPTTAESGLPDFEVSVWHGLYAPEGTSTEIVEQVSAALQKALADETVIARFGDLGTAPSSQEEATPAAHAERLTSQIELWRPIIEQAGVYAD